MDLKPNFPPIIWIFTEGEGDEIESRLSSKIFLTLIVTSLQIGYAFQCTNMKIEGFRRSVVPLQHKLVVFLALCIINENILNNDWNLSTTLMPKGLFTNYVDNFLGFFDHQRPSFTVSILLNFFSFIFFWRKGRQ